MADQAVGSGGDYAVFLGGTVHLNGTTNCIVDHNLFDGVGGNAVWLTDYNRHASVSANEMRHIGENGVGMRGSTDWVDGECETNTPIVYYTSGEDTGGVLRYFLDGRRGVGWGGAGHPSARSM